VLREQAAEEREVYLLVEILAEIIHAETVKVLRG
jgi:hypothetical protein